jgi:FtsP/CotA-like multicopper oxidase with cupredoxin domain
VRKERFTPASGEEIDGYTVNGTSPGPVIRAVQGQLVEVRLVNASVPDGVTLHWHGVDVPNAEDGVAGVTQDAVPAGGSFTYRFVADQPGTYWYHSHQVSHAQVQGGLLGALVVTPRPPPPDGATDQLAVLHVYDGTPTVNGASGEVPVDAPDGSTVRVRIVNTDNGATTVWTPGGSYRVLAVDGYDLHGPTQVSDRAVRLTAGGRVDLEVTAPARVELGGASALLVGSGAPAATPQPDRLVDLLTYGSRAPLGFDPAHPDRTFRYSIGRRPGFVDGRPGLWWSINGHLFPDVPMFVVEQGDVVQMHLENHSGAVHPMHLHGHHAVVLDRNGVKATGSPWWVDSLDVASGDSYDIAFVADNPGIWMDHCHNLPHAAQGLVAHLMYAGLTEPFRVGGGKDNQPE